jgi:hypothetical protein
LGLVTGANRVRTIYARNVNEAYTIGLNALDAVGNIEDSRVGRVKVFPTPVSTIYERPCERVLFNKKRDANPFFHLMESLWMLAGRNDVDWIQNYNSKFGQFSDDGTTFNAAYGYRWRKQFNRDQLVELVQMLKRDPNTRRAVVSMWDPYADFNAEGKDFPCNLNIAFRIRNGKLTMTVFNRSNDIIWGAYGANAVHMSILQEFIASALELPVGEYTQVSNDYHAYTNVLAEVGIPDPHPMCPYDMGRVQVIPLISDLKTWHDTLFYFMADTHLFHELKFEANYRFDMKRFSQEPFFCDVAVPMVRAWGRFKHKDYKEAIKLITETMPECDWKTNCREWLIRKAERNATSNAEKRRLRQTVAHDN